MDEPLRASSSQASLHSLKPAASASSHNNSNNKGQGGHIHALRSLGLLHELQEYVAACVETQQQQEKELGKLKAEKKEVDRVLKQKAVRGPEKQPCLQQFQASEICDLPPRLRALFEDNKVLKESTRRYKQRVQEAERHAAGLEQQLLAAHAANSRLKAQLLEGHAAWRPDSDAALARQQADAFSKALEKLQHAHQVLQQKLDTDARLHRQALAAAGKDRQHVEQQVQELQEQLESKDKEARAHALAAKQAQRKLEEVKSAAAKAVAGVNARVADAVAAVEARCKQAEDARVHLMLCVLHEPAGSCEQPRSRLQEHNAKTQEVAHPASEGVWAEDSSSNIGRNAAVSSYYSGTLSREQAVLRLQAGARGHLARKQLRRQRQQQEEEGLVLVQAGGVQSTPPHRDLLQDQTQASSTSTSGNSCGGIATSSSSAGAAHAGIMAADSLRTEPGCKAPTISGSSLPLELPALGVSPEQVDGNNSAEPLLAAAAAGRAVAPPVRNHSVARGVSGTAAAAPAAHGPPTRGARQRVSAAATGAAAVNPTGHYSRKPPVPVATRPAPPTSAPPRSRAVRQTSNSAAAAKCGLEGTAVSAGPVRGSGSAAATLITAAAGRQQKQN